LAWSPATPTPITRTLIGLMVPAGVVIMGMIRAARAAPRITAT
jgi:hypothetical protein